MKYGAYLAASTALLFALSYGAWTAYRSARFYTDLKVTGRGWRDPAMAFDPELGYAPIPGRESVELFPHGRRVSVRHDSEGFRVPVGGEIQSGRPYVLALGDSFTFATACRATESFSYHVAQGLGGAIFNAGVEGYGLVQMVLVARRLIPSVQPDIVLVEYAPWLLLRSLSGELPAWGGYSLAIPYVSALQEGRLSIQGPSFRSALFDRPTGSYVNGPPSILEFASFFFNVGAPVAMNWDWAWLTGARGKWTKSRENWPPPKDILKAAYGEIRDLCAASGSRMIVVALESGGFGPEERDSELLRLLAELGESTFVDAYALLWSRLSSPTPQSYERAYGIWTGDPPQLVDRHPNPECHALIAETILTAARKG